MKRKPLIATLAVLAAVVGVGLVLVPRARERARRARCISPLHCCIRKAMRLYAMDNHGRFPSNIASFAAGYAGNPKLYLCPGSGTTPGAITNVDAWMDYIYIYWPDGEQTPTNYPWLYERRLRHHWGQGIHVAPIDGPAFFDKGARWLQTFAREHPELDLPLPEDLNGK